MEKLIATNEQGRRVGEDHPRAKLTDHEVELIRSLHENDGLCYRDLAEKFCVPKSTVQMICQYTRRNSTVAGWKLIKRPVAVES